MSSESPAHRSWRESNRDKCRRYGLKWYRANRDRVAAYKAANPHIYRNANKRRRNKRRDIVRVAKDKPCADCGQRYPWFCMDFDHVRGTKLFNIGSPLARNFSVAALVDEIAKCDVVCVMCHRWRTHSEVD